MASDSPDAAGGPRRPVGLPPARPRRPAEDVTPPIATPPEAPPVETTPIETTPIETPRGEERRLTPGLSPTPFKPIREGRVGGRTLATDLTPSGLVPIRAQRPERAPGMTPLQVDLAIFGGTLAVGLLIAAYLYYGLDLWNADSLSRTIDAQSVLFSRDPHLGAIGFVWPPLPTLTRIMLLPVTHLAGMADFTGQLSSVLFAAVTVVMLHRILAVLGLTPAVRVTWMGAALLNPVVILHFANGTAESAFTLLVLLVLYSALRLDLAPLPALTGMGLALALALLVRYEALAIAGTTALAVLIYSVMRRRRAESQQLYVRTEAMLVALLSPIVFVGLMWLYFNWSIQGDALFFYTSPYSIRGAADVARNAPGHVLEYAVHSVPGTASYIVERTLQVSALFIPASVALALFAWRRRDPIALLLLMVSLSIHAMQAYQAYTGSIAPWLRYWVYLPLLTPILLAYVLERATWSAALGGRGARNALVFGLVPTLVLASNAVAFDSMRSPEVGYDEQILAHVLAGDRTSEERVRSAIPSKDFADEIAERLNAVEGTVLLDKQRGGLFLLNLDDPTRLVIDSDRDFLKLLHSPVGAVDWVLLPDPHGDTDAVLSHDSIYLVYPDLYEGAPWLALDHEFTGNKDWRLYRVVEPPQPAVPPPPGERPTDAP
ncbi:MAG: hypothetical protein M0R73_06560 [Dehalococcoidia bacterium]|nr:hypothetical protein [Dehalococcoidia bacterium]